MLTLVLPDGAAGDAYRTESAVAHAFAEALNYSGSSALGTEAVTLRIRLLGTAAEWSRDATDGLLRCVDRAVGRLYPPADPVQYLSESSPLFSSSGSMAVENTEGSSRTVTFEVRPTASFNSTLSPALKGGRVPKHVVSGGGCEGSVNPIPFEWVAVAVKDDDEAMSSLQHSTPTAEDADLWCLARRARQAEELGESPCLFDSHNKDAAKLQWRLASWLVERLQNESGWAMPRSSAATASGGSHGRKFSIDQPSASKHFWKVKFCPRFTNAIEAALQFGRGKEDRPRVLHADVRGMEFCGLIVALSAQYAYVGCPAHPASSDMESSRNWCLMTRVPRPTDLLEGAEGASLLHGGKKRPRGDDVGEGGGCLETLFYNAAEAVLHDDLAQLQILPVTAQHVVTVRSHRVFCKAVGTSLPPRDAPLGPDHLSLWFDDAIILSRNPLHSSSGTVVEATVNTYPDLLGLVRESCRRFVQMGESLHTRWLGCLPPQAATAMSVAEDGSEPTSPLAKNSAPSYVMPLYISAASLYSAMVNTASVYFKKARGGAKGVGVPAVQTCKDIERLEECCQVEFKYRIEAATTTKKQIMSAERLRHTMAAMASTLGGVVCVGVTDDGRIVGHPQGQVAALVRTTGFCPAMVKDSVAVKEIRVLASASEPSGRRTMPKEWWKQQAVPEATNTRTTAASTVVTVFTVSKGQAPFYSSGRHSVPYVRGCASTTPMPVLVMAHRLYRQLHVGL